MTNAAQVGDEVFPWVNEHLNANTQVGMAARVISRWGKDWHREGSDEATYASAYNDIMDLADTVTKLLADRATTAATIASLEVKQESLIAESYEVEQVLGSALGYPRYCDDPINFPDATEQDGVCTGEHTAGTIAQEAARTIAELRQQLDEMQAKFDQAFSDATFNEANYNLLVEDLENENERLRQEVDTVAHNNSVLNAEIVALREQVAEMQTKFDQAFSDATFNEANYNLLVEDLEGENKRLRQQVADVAGWEDVEYNDIINVDNNNQLRVVINCDNPDGKVHLHIRKRVNGEWRHAGITTLLSNYRLQRRKAGGDE